MCPHLDRQDCGFAGDQSAEADLDNNEYANEPGRTGVQGRHLHGAMPGAAISLPTCPPGARWAGEDTGSLQALQCLPRASDLFVQVPNALSEVVPSIPFSLLINKPLKMQGTWELSALRSRHFDCQDGMLRKNRSGGLQDLSEAVRPGQSPGPYPPFAWKDATRGTLKFGTHERSNALAKQSSSGWQEA